jgi:ABC-type branched-subunit amino acid transport system substrate-binding protein
MSFAGRLALAGLALTLACEPARAQTIPRAPSAGAPAAPRSGTSEKEAGGKEPTKEAKPSLPSFRIGALLPLTGAASWFGKEMRQGMELAVTELNRPRRAGPRADRLEGAPGEAHKATMAARRANEALGPAPGANFVLEAADVPAANLKQATEEFARMAALPAAVVVTASPTPTLAVQPAAAARDVLLVHQGQVTARLAPGSRTLLQTRPSPAARAEAAAAYAAERRLRRLAVLAAGDDFGRAARAALAARWRERGGSLVEESLTLEAPDLGARLRQLARRAPEAVVLAVQGADLGDFAIRLRGAGYAGPLFLLDDDPAALLAGGVALQDATVFSDGFAPELGSTGQRFAEAYAKKYGGPPSRYAAGGYDAVMVVAAGVRAGLEDKRGTPGGTRLRETLLRLRRFPSVFGGEVALRDDGALVRPLALFTIDDGTLSFVRYVPPGGPG